MIEARYVLSGLTGQQHDSLRRTIAVDVAIAMSALHVLGVAVLDRGADHDPAEDSAELTALGRYAIRRLHGMAQAGDPLLQVRITLMDVDDPPVWRRVLIPAAYPLDRVHTVIQAAMGWQNYHMHAFRVGDVSYGRPDPDGELGFLDERKVQLGDLAADRIEYEYDFGDGWEHELVIEARMTAEDGAIYPACVAGEGACPPEDCGGSDGFEDFKELLTGPPSAERDEMLEWAGGDYDPALQPDGGQHGGGGDLTARPHASPFDQAARTRATASLIRFLASSRPMPDMRVPFLAHIICIRASRGGSVLTGQKGRPSLAQAAARGRAAARGDEHMAFVQIIEFRTPDIDKAREIDEEWWRATEGKRTVRREVLARDRSDPSRCFGLVFFDSYESAMENSDLPETKSSAEQYRKISDGPPVFYDLEIVEDRA